MAPIVTGHAWDETGRHRGSLQPTHQGWWSAGGQIVIDNSSLATLTQRTPILGQPIEVAAGTDRDGRYKALCVSHRGDTRGQEWYTEIIGLAVDPTAAIPLGGPTLLVVPG